MTIRRRTALIIALAMFAIVVVLAITTGAKAHAATTTATRVATPTAISLHDTRAATTSVPRHHLKWYVLKWAETQAGKPYAWGGIGLGSYDCSGLVWRAWSRFGKTLPRTTSEMQASSHFYRIPRSKLAPGDVVFWGNYHVEFATKDGTFGAHESGTLVGWARYWGSPTFWRVR
jgi:cell wall-associated NlpC family hydrolase